MKKIVCILSACLLSIGTALAVVASPEPFEFTKADGTKVMARVYGDEFHSYVESVDGELLRGNRDEAALEHAEQLRRVHRVRQAAGSTAFPTTGSPKSLVLLVSFSDLAMGTSHDDFNDLLNKSGYDYNGATGSCRDYYIASSDSLFQPQFDCYGPYKLSHNMAYYGADEGDSHSVHGADMVAEACQMAHEAGVNFKDYDTNNDGLLDNVFIFFAGNNQAEGADDNTIWPHQGSISYKNIRLDGVLVGSYACTSEYKGSASKVRCGIGTFCHEFGHVIGQPDFYDTNYQYYTVGNWDIMCQGSYNNHGNTPPTFSAYERMYEGWLTPKQLELPGRYSLNVIPGQAEAYLIAAETHNLSGKSPNPSEFFILENRNSNNIWDSYLPGHGMIVWHIDYSASAWTNNSPNNGPTIMRMHLEEANGVSWKSRSQGEDGRSSDLYPGTMNVTTFTPKLHNGTQLAQPIFNITETSGIVSFTYISEGGSSLRANKELIETTTTLDDNNKVVAWEPQSFELLGTGLAPDGAITLKVNGSDFKVYAGDEAPVRTSSFWKTTTTITPNADSTLQQTIWVNYNPKKQNCETSTATLTISSSAASLSLPLAGTAPRHTYVTTPEVLAAQEITPYSFAAQWKAVEDAECYYFTLYQMSEGETTYSQDFENFDSYDNIRDMGWQSNTNLTTTSDKKDGKRALYLKNYGDQIISETYPTAVTNMSFWFNAFTSTTDTIGVLEIEAYNGEEWVLIENKVMSNRDKRVTANYDFEEEKNYRAFRLTWLDNGGSGIAFDAFTATTSKLISYIYKGKEDTYVPYTIEATYQRVYTGLEPNNEYYWQVQCTDLNKGCEEHLTALSEPIIVTTLNGNPVDGKLLTIGYDSITYTPATHLIYVTSASKNDRLYFYNPAGRLVHTIKMSDNVYSYALPLGLFRQGEVYIVQHAKEGKLSRKNQRIKFIY